MDIAEFTPLVKRIAYHMMTRLPASVQVDDLIQDGMIGMFEALKHRRDGYTDRQFYAYVKQRISGSILDALRGQDLLPGIIRKKMRRIEAAVNLLEQRKGCAPSEQDLAQELDMSLDEYHETLQSARCAQLVYYEDFQQDDEDHFLDRMVANSDDDPLNSLLDESFRNQLIAAINNLPPREKQMMEMYYDQEMNLREIGEVMGVSESRVCQLHTQAVKNIKKKIYV